MPKADDLLDINEAAELLGCSLSTIERAKKRGEISTVKVGKLIRYRRADLLNTHARQALDSVGPIGQK
ncbi:MAG TPA: DNA-binding protein [Planctomycetaceae bacterium]|nr:DNA-binding protein [Planctomycetaceae bacterium]